MTALKELARGSNQVEQVFFSLTDEQVLLCPFAKLLRMVLYPLLPYCWAFEKRVPSQYLLQY